MIRILICAYMVVGWSCSSPSSSPNPTPSAPLPAPLLPVAGKVLRPSMLTIGNNQVATVHEAKVLAKVDDCGACHPDVQAQWRSSAHAFASFNNPVYRASIESFRDAVGKKPSRFCAGCHDPAFLVDGAIDDDIAPQDSRVHAGVSCRVCHGASQVAPDGNASFHLDLTEIPLPREGDLQSVKAHRKAVQRRAVGDDLCISCHRSFLGPETGHPQHLAGMDDAAAWRDSPYAGNGIARVDDAVDRKGCIDCHMPKVDALDDAAARGGKISSHRIHGGHTWLAAMRGDTKDLAARQRFLRGVASVDIAAVRDSVGNDTLLAAGAPLVADATVTLDVVIRNLHVGHRFPGGILDAHDTWLEVVVSGADGRVLASAGLQHDRGDADDTHVLRALVVDDQARMQLERKVEHFRGTIVNHTVAPRDAIVQRFAFRVPKRAPVSLKVVARLKHRSRNLVIQQRACKATKNTWGLAFARASQRRAEHKAVDPCRPQPVTVIASTNAVLGTAQGQHRNDAKARQASWRRLLEHGMALTHDVQEKLDDARPSLQAALTSVRKTRAGAKAEAMVFAQLARVAGRQGRTDEAYEYLREARARVGEHPALAAISSAASARVWRWRRAADMAKSTTMMAPGNLSGWKSLAIALGSLGDDRGAYDAAQRGLRLAPRDSDLLRVQALSLQGVEHHDADVALAAYDRYRANDELSRLRLACAAQDERCGRERSPIHIHKMRQHFDSR